MGGLKRRKMKKLKKKLICKNCETTETLENVFYSAVTKILTLQIPRMRKKDGLHIYPLYCLNCDYITEWAADPFNVSGNAIEGIEYFKTFKINNKYKKFFYYTKNNLLNRGYTKTEYIKYSIGWFFILCAIYSIIKSI